MADIYPTTSNMMKMFEFHVKYRWNIGPIGNKSALVQIIPVFA